MGGGAYFPTYQEAADHLLQRNLPDIATDCQQRMVVIPEVHLPKVPRAVDHYLIIWLA